MGHVLPAQFRLMDLPLARRAWNANNRVPQNHSLDGGELYHVRQEHDVESTTESIIPTLYKAKISHELSYPIGAERISAALRSAAQFTELQLRFTGHYGDNLRKGHYWFLSVHFAGKATSAAKFLDSLGRPLFYEWEIWVQPVPRVLRHKTMQYITASALPHIRTWLEEREHIAQQGRESLQFFYDERTEEFIPKQETSPAPVRERGR